MEFDLTWLLLGLPLAFVLGWMASRFDMRQLRIDNKRSPKAYFKGLNHLLNEQQDEAIDAFIEAVRKDPDTSELHFALGNLFRRRGEYDRAVRVHEHLMARGDLSKTERDRAQHALSLDFLKAGLLDRAEDALSHLENTKYEQEARLARLAIYERTRDWPQAQHVAQQLQDSKTSKHGDFSHRIAHYLCEQAENAAPENKSQLLEKALQIAPQSGRASIALAQAQQSSGDTQKALATLLAGLQSAPSATPLIASQMAQLPLQAPDIARVLEALQPLYDSTHSLDLLQAISQLQTAATNGGQGSTVDASSSIAVNTLQQLQLKHLQHEPSLVTAAQLLKSQGIHSDIQRALDKAAQPLLRYRCAACGFEASRHFWQCPGCQNWDSYSSRRVEEL